MTTKEVKDDFICPHCKKCIESGLINSWKARQVGRITSAKKAASSAKNGKKGGRPRKADAKPESIKRREKRNANKTENNK